MLADCGEKNGYLNMKILQISKVYFDFSKSFFNFHIH
jgi:hypothetical protein